MNQVDWSQGIPVNIGRWQVGLTEPSPETAGYWEGIAAGELRMKICEGCGKFHHPRRILCWRCGSTQMNWVRVSGSGSVYTFSTIHRASEPDFQDDVPYTVGIAMLDEGVPIFTRFVYDEDDVGLLAVGTRVEVDFRRLGGVLLPVMRLLAPDGAGASVG